MHRRALSQAVAACLATVLGVSLSPASVPPDCDDGGRAWNSLQIATAAIVLPPAMTFVEVVAPHSWDNALLLLVGNLGVALVFVMPGGKGVPDACGDDPWSRGESDFSLD